MGVREKVKGVKEKKFEDLYSRIEYEREKVRECRRKES